MEQLIEDLKQMRAGVLENNYDTVWVGEFETLIDYIDALLIKYEGQK